MILGANILLKGSGVVFFCINKCILYLKSSNTLPIPISSFSSNAQ